ncbi:unnamed protein product [Arctia plantaginis]|uniref:RNA-directed DNA polymerase n=1 Tax=Arctia plantaginis TaxID=874455 RepID=A0A8S0Z733_ARCPL|nr:unnamed protein product [Arctia plantaginis]
MYFVKNGWPKNFKDLDHNVKQFWTFRDELGLIDGIILKSNLIVIPESLRKDMLHNIHQGHAGLSTCKIRARSCVFWPEINKDLEVYVRQCTPCAKYRPNIQKEPLIHHTVEKIPWHKIGIDICTLDKTDFLILVDYYSKFLEVCKLDNLSSECVITNCKSIFARHGIPAYVVTDPGTQFTSEQFKKFANVYNFIHVKTSPKHSQSNGQSESGVNIFKNIMKKCTEDGSDPYLGLLNYRNTPKLYMPSPAQLLYSRNLNSLLPFSKNKLKPKIMSYGVKYDNHIKNVKNYYDKNAKPLSELNIGQKVFFKKTLDSNWIKGTILKKCDEPRSYLVVDEKGIAYRRNRKYLMPYIEPKNYSVNEKTNINNIDRFGDYGPDVSLPNKVVSVPESNVMSGPDNEYLRNVFTDNIVKEQNDTDVCVERNIVHLEDNVVSGDCSTLSDECVVIGKNTVNLEYRDVNKDISSISSGCAIEVPTIIKSRKGRVITKPRRFKDYVDFHSESD